MVRSQAYLELPDSEIRTNIRTNLSDGGVDTEICKPIPNDPTGWLGNHPTALQYKATDFKNIACKVIFKEINKSYATNCIKKRYAYHICICDDLPADKKEEREICLNEYIKKINPDAPTGKIISASDLAAWANRFPALILYFRPDMIQSSFLHLKAWGKNITSLTPEYVSIPIFESISQQIIYHSDFKNDVPEVALSISGEAGVGKTRLVYESLKDMCNLVIYTDDEQKAREIARILANDCALHAILVADECSVDGCLYLNEGLRGVKDRVRVITIDNSGEHPFSGSPEPWLKRIPRDFVEEILEKNYPDVPIERRRVYADRTGGFVMLAAYLCNNDGTIANAGNVEPILGIIRDYLTGRRLGEVQMKVLQALSLVTKVGMKDDVAQELNDLCNLVGIDPRHFKEVANKLHDNPGFVGKGGRYFSVTPEIIAQVGFEGAWNRWARTDPEDFLKRIPQSILEKFYKRASISASEEVRQIIGETFRRWANDIKTKQLASVETVDLIVTLIEVDPTRYLPLLLGLVEEASIEELKSVTGDISGGRWGPRRSLVWLAEKIAAFPEHFENAERILFRLALAESEPSLSNNATGIWKGLFSIYLSGTAVPFEKRLQRLEERILNVDGEFPAFAIDALQGAFRSNFTRHAGPSVVAGKITPVDWQPRDNAEYKKCVDSSVSLLQKLTDRKRSPPEVVLYSQKFAIKNTRFLLGRGYLSQIKPIFTDPLSDETRIELIQAVEAFLHYDTKKKNNRPGPSEPYIDEVKAWLVSLKPLDFHGILVYLIGSNQFHILDHEDLWRSEIRSLAIECLENQDAFKKEVDWLYSSHAKNTLVLGQELGNLDEDVILLDFIFESCIRFKSVELARGYVYSLLEAYPHHAALINEKIDCILEDSPEIGYELYLAGGKLTNAFQRTIQLVDDKKLSARYLGRFMLGFAGRDLTLEELTQILERLLDGLGKGDSAVIHISLQFLAFRLNDESKKGEKSILEQSYIRDFAWRLVEVSSVNGVEDSYWWIEIIKALASYDAERAVKIASHGFVGESIDHEDDCKEFLISIAEENPELVMRHVGELILEDSTGWAFISGRYRSFIQSLPSETVINWIEAHGIKAARKLAGNLPTPFVDSEDNAVVPPLTEYVLETFEEDNETFDEFYIGVHNLQGYSGTIDDIAAQHDQEAETAKKFFDHRLKRVREWAQLEEENARDRADRERQFGEERWLK